MTKAGAIGTRVSAKRARANALNAKRSTGPKTTAGKGRSSRNAVRHGLSRGIEPGSADADMAKQLAVLLARGSNDPAVLMHAATIADCTVTLDRIARLRSTLAEGVAPKPLSSRAELRRLLRHMKAAGTAVLDSANLTLSVAKHRVGEAKGRELAWASNPAAREAAILAKLKQATHEPEDAIGAPLSRAATEILRTHRYEQRALSRRKKAVLSLDALLAAKQ